jgi:hypothetical protein
MKIERHETGPRMSKAVIHGDTVYLAGIVADSPKGKGMAEQTRSKVTCAARNLWLSCTRAPLGRAENEVGAWMARQLSCAPPSSHRGVLIDSKGWRKSCSGNSLSPMSLP